MQERKVLTDKSLLFSPQEAEVHYVRAAPDSDEYLKVWIKEPTWLQVEKALNTVMKIGNGNNVDLDLNAMYRYMVENFIEKTEPSLSTIDLIRISPYVGNQIKEILPNPFDTLQEGEVKNDE